MNLDSFPLIYKRLFKFARTFVRGEDAAMDLASDTYASILPALTGDAGADFAYASAALKNRWRLNRRNAKRRGYDTAIDIHDQYTAKTWPVVTMPTQEVAAEVSRMWERVRALKEPSRTVLTLAALEWSIDEISDALSMKRKDVYWRLGHSRKIIRAQTGWQAAKKDGQHVGIRRDCHRWQAYIRKNGKYVNLGRYDTASEAAAAYARAAA